MGNQTQGMQCSFTIKKVSFSCAEAKKYLLKLNYNVIVCSTLLRLPLQCRTVHGAKAHSHTNRQGFVQIASLLSQIKSLVEWSSLVHF